MKGVLTMAVNYDPKGIRSQSQFCVELMLRLNEEIKKAGEGYWSGMELVRGEEGGTA